MLSIKMIARTLPLICGVAGGVGAAWRLTGPATSELVDTIRAGRLTRPGWTLEHLVENLASALCLVAVLGLAGAVLLALAGTLAADRAPRLSAACARVSPPLCLRLVAACCGLGLVGPLAFGSPATAADVRSPSCQASCGDTTRGLGGLALPDLPDGTWQPAMPVDASDTPSGQGGSAPQIVVRPGDSLWRIAEAELPADASLAQVAALVQRLYALNHGAIGGDPDLIFPGTALRTPEGRP